MNRSVSSCFCFACLVVLMASFDPWPACLPVCLPPGLPACQYERLKSAAMFIPIQLQVMACMPQIDEETDDIYIYLGYTHQVVVTI